MENLYGNYQLFAREAQLELFTQKIHQAKQQWLHYLKAHYTGVGNLADAAGKHVIITRGDLNNQAPQTLLKKYFATNGTQKLVLDANVGGLPLS